MSYPIYGSDYDDNLTGDASDNLFRGSFGNDTLNGGAGTDTVSYMGQRLDFIVANLLTGKVEKRLNPDRAPVTGNGFQTDTLIGIENIEGTSGNDVLTGNAGNNRLYGLEGSDRFYGTAGNDTLDGGVGRGTQDAIGSGIDTADYSLSGMAGGIKANLATGIVEKFLTAGLTTPSYTDTLVDIEDVVGTSAADILTGNGGNNGLYGGGGNDTLNGAAGDDLLHGDTGLDWLLGGDGQDMIYGDDGDDIIGGQNEDDRIWGGNGEDVLFGDGGDDTLYGEADKDTLWGQGGNDILYGGAGDDLLYGEADNDRLCGSAGNDRLDGGTGGIDTADYSGAFLVSGIKANLATGTVGKVFTVGNPKPMFTDTLVDIEDVVGTAVADILTGNDLPNGLFGGGGDDDLSGEGGNDLIHGDDGNDLLYGGDGDDRMGGQNNDDHLWGGTGNDLLFGDDGNDILYGEADDDTLEGQGGNDLLVGGIGSDTYAFFRGGGTDTIQENPFDMGIDLLQFLGDIRFDQLWFRHTGNDLEVSVIGTADKTVVKDWYSGSASLVEQIKSSDGKLLLDTKVALLVDAMAGFAPPAMGQTSLNQTSLTAAQQTQLTNVLTANWH